MIKDKQCVSVFCPDIETLNREEPLAKQPTTLWRPTGAVLCCCVCCHVNYICCICSLTLSFHNVTLQCVCVC